MKKAIYAAVAATIAAGSAVAHSGPEAHVCGIDPASVSEWPGYGTRGNIYDRGDYFFAVEVTDFQEAISYKHWNKVESITNHVRIYKDDCRVSDIEIVHPESEPEVVAPAPVVVTEPAPVADPAPVDPEVDLWEQLKDEDFDDYTRTYSEVTVDNNDPFGWGREIRTKKAYADTDTHYLTISEMYGVDYNYDGSTVIKLAHAYDHHPMEDVVSSRYSSRYKPTSTSPNLRTGPQSDYVSNRDGRSWNDFYVKQQTTNGLVDYNPNGK